jgi:NDP-sugar pyrophosphorylase family protein
MLPLVLLAGGLATRMRPVTETIPKAMIEVAGMPFIHQQFQLFRKRGIGRVLLCIGWLGEQIRDFIGDGKQYSLSVEYFEDGEKLLGTGGAIRNIDDSLPEDFFVMYGDSYLDTDYARVESAYRASGKKGLMTVFHNAGKWDVSNVVFSDGTLVSYSKRKRRPDMCYIDYGLGILDRSVFMEHAVGEHFDLADVYERLSLDGELSGYEVFERFYEIGSPDGLSELCAELSQPVIS